MSVNSSKTKRKSNLFSFVSVKKILVGAGPHTAVFFFVLSWTTLAYCLNHMWVYLTTGVRLSKKRDLIVHGLIVILYFVALGFNIWGYDLSESASHVTTADAFSPGVCRGDTNTW